MNSKLLRAVIIKPSKYDKQGYVERFRWGFMPNSTLRLLLSMLQGEFEGCRIDATAIDEYVQTDLNYLKLLTKGDCPTLLLLVGVQSHQLQRAIDLGLFAKQHGVEHCVLGGPHPMTCLTDELEGKGISFSVSEAEVVLPTILHDVVSGNTLQAIYGKEQRWKHELDSPAIIPPSARDLRRYVMSMEGLDAARGCPKLCTFCSVPGIFGMNVRSQPVKTTIQSLVAAKKAGVKRIMFTSDNFNKNPLARELLGGMIEAQINIPFFVQCDAEIADEEKLVALLAQAGCWQMFMGVESVDPEILKAAKKFQNDPKRYGEIVNLCRKYGIASHFSNIIGFEKQREEDILEHYRTLYRLNPTIASIYILTMIPGTTDYVTAMRRGIITEKNLDRFDATCLTWAHPLGKEKLEELLYKGYREFCSIRATIEKLTSHDARMTLSKCKNHLSYFLFTRWCTWKRMHPMSGGIGKVYLDNAANYADLRRKHLGFDLVPLPKKRPTPEVDKDFNRQSFKVQQV